MLGSLNRFTIAFDGFSWLELADLIRIKPKITGHCTQQESHSALTLIGGFYGFD